MKKNAFLMLLLPLLGAVALGVYSCQKSTTVSEAPQLSLSEQSVDSREYTGECSTNQCRGTGTIELLSVSPDGAFFFLDVVATQNCTDDVPPEDPYCHVASYSNNPNLPPTSPATLLGVGKTVSIPWQPGKKYWFTTYSENPAPSTIVVKVKFGSTSNTYTLNSQNFLTGPYSLPNCNSTIFQCYDPG
ncbi:MAG: hypothetical protein IT260_05510 [Saprospiraceae bacterium]|nr:hypothetical protein [Saprospiraceae bacterium]